MATWRCVTSTVLAPVYVVCAATDFGVPAILPLWSHETYWEEYCYEKHKRLDECPNKYGPHVHGKHKADRTPYVDRWFRWVWEND